MRARSWLIGAALCAVTACGAKQHGYIGITGLPEEKAKSQCDQIAQTEERCWNDQVAAECNKCLMECGLNCGQSAGCPIRFHCPE